MTTPSKGSGGSTGTPQYGNGAGGYCPDHPEVDCSLDLRRDPDNTWW
jgi:hypothetical protein